MRIIFDLRRKFMNNISPSVALKSLMLLKRKNSVKKYSISGTITDGVSGVDGVTVALGAYSATTAGGGLYSIAGIAPGASGDLTPTLSTWTFSPAIIAISAMSGNLVSQDFTAAPWYLAGGISLANLAAIWSPVNAASLDASYTRIAGDQGNADVDPTVVGGTAPTWAAGSGWKFSTNQYLKSGVIPTDAYSMIIQFSNVVLTDQDVLAGQYNDVSGAAMFLIQTRVAGMDVYHGNGNFKINAPLLTAGFYGISGKQAYRDGLPDGVPIVAGGATAVYREIFMGANNYQNGTVSGCIEAYIQRIVFYKTTLTDVQNAAVVSAARGLPVMVAFGDSIAAGVGATTTAQRWTDIVAATKSWYLINKGISSTALQNSVQNAVSTVGGVADSNGRDTYAARVTAYSPIWVFILYGLNDLRLNDAGFTVTNYQNDLGEIVDGIVAAGTPADHIVIGSPPYMDPDHYADGSPWNAGTTIKHVAYVAAAAAVATAKGTLYKDIYQYMLDNGADTLLGADGIHPNDTGHAAIATAFLSVL
jgi:lysophospholipase L1-like esterase